MNNNDALILMSTYQGAAFLSAQIDSIIAQTHENWVLIIRDDGSTDDTLNIARQYQEQDKRIIVIHDQFGNLKPAQSFSKLMEIALTRNEAYLFFADQDDVWLPEKLSLFIETFSNEHQDKPLLVFSDLTVVDQALQCIHPSYLAYEQLQANTHSPLRTLLVHNFVTGCAMAINRALLMRATPLPLHAIMHDWWCALCAASEGQLKFIAKPTVLYRQHGNNDTGSRGFYNKFLPLHKSMTHIKQLQQRFANRFLQVSELLARLDDSNQHFHYIQRYLQLPHLNTTERIQTSWQLHLQLSGLIRKTGFFLWLMVQP